MVKKRAPRDLYTGRSGQLAAIAELLYRGLNAAIPEVDTGDDIFVVRDDEETVTRVQVKSANARETKVGYYAQFNVPLEQLEAPADPPRSVGPP
jgi:hypothetical protein